jgi:hypothetical protein
MKTIPDHQNKCVLSVVRKCKILVNIDAAAAELREYPTQNKQNKKLTEQSNSFAEPIARFHRFPEIPSLCFFRSG